MKQFSELTGTIKSNHCSNQNRNNIRDTRETDVEPFYDLYGTFDITSVDEKSGTNSTVVSANKKLETIGMKVHWNGSNYTIRSYFTPVFY